MTSCAIFPKNRKVKSQQKLSQVLWYALTMSLTLSLHFDLRHSIRVATWNVLTLIGTGYQTPLGQELEKYNIAIADLTEARLQDNDLSTVYLSDL